MRLFIALNLSEEQKKEIHILQQRLKTYLAGVKWVDPVLMHLTLKFLGEVEQKKLEAVCEAMRSAAQVVEPFHVFFGGGGVFPHPQKARVIWTGLGGEKNMVIKLALNLEAALVERGFPASDRPFKPHLTLGRPRYPLPQDQIERFLAEAQNFSTAGCQIDMLTLYQSHLSPRGAVYTVLNEIKLGRF